MWDESVIPLLMGLQVKVATFAVGSLLRSPFLAVSSSPKRRFSWPHVLRRGTEVGQTGGLEKEAVTVWDYTAIHLLENFPEPEIH